jgi:D-tagatose-1,6-bisphosphate aldolase subunit GatZ/KbaZ
MFLEKVVAAQKSGVNKGITSICSSHPWVINAALHGKEEVLIEATCNQVNQFGGYSGMTPAKFISFVRGIANENDFPIEKIILGGDHLGPNVWQDEPAAIAMEKSETLIRDFIEAGFSKIHLDCSMRLRDDPPEPLDLRISAQRTARLVKVAETTKNKKQKPPYYVIGTEVPIPGGAHADDKHLHITEADDVSQMLEVSQKVFKLEGLQSAWNRVIAVVVQPGVEYGDDFIVRYDRELAKNLSQFVENLSLIYEAHSTDYQNPIDLSNLVEDHFGILKVGPALTFAFREAVFTLAKIEDELFSDDCKSDLINVIDTEMKRDPKYWINYYSGDDIEKEFARKFGLSDRIRYYWSRPIVQDSLKRMLNNFTNISIPCSILRQYGLNQGDGNISGKETIKPQSIIIDRIFAVLKGYQEACN